MKFTPLAFLAVVGCVSAGKPQISREKFPLLTTPTLPRSLPQLPALRGRTQLQISVRDGQYQGLDGLDPTLSWSDETTAGDMDLSYGIKASVRPTSDLASLPRSIWGKATTDISGWGVSARAELDGQNFKNADIELDAANAQADLRVHVDAQAGDNMFVRSVEATKGLNQNGARITVTPRYNLETEDTDVVLTYSKDKTDLKLTASADNQEITISQQVDKDNRIAPTVNNQGDMSVEWERRLSVNSSFTANLKPNDCLDVEWKDAAWTATVNMPIDGANVKGVNVGIRRDVEF